MKKNDPFQNLVLDREEKEIEDALERGEYVRDRNFKARKKMFEEAAKIHIELRKSKRITIRVNNEDLIKMKARAKRARIPYQRLIGALIHKFVEGQAKLEV